MAGIIASRGVLLASLLAACAAVAGCSSTTSGNDGGAETGSDVGSDSSMNALDATDVQSADTPPVIDTFPPTDTSLQDAPQPGDGGFVCGSMQCDSATQYCQILRGRAPDGGVVDDYRCDSFDIACPTEHTCACLQRSLKCSNSCTMDNGGVTTVCGN